jgi:hypothetical protein
MGFALGVPYKSVTIVFFFLISKQTFIDKKRKAPLSTQVVYTGEPKLTYENPTKTTKTKP